MSAVTLERTTERTEDPVVETRVRKKVPVKRLLIYAGLMAAIGGGATYGHDYWTNGRYLISTDDAYVGGDVTVLASKVAGFVVNVAVTDNQRVKVGDLLFRIDPRDFRVALASAEATLAARNAALANLDASERLQQAVIAQADAEVTASEADTQRTKFDEDRYKALAASKYASEQRFEQADADYKKALAANLRAKAALDAAKRQLDVIGTQKQQARAAIDQAKADRDMAALNLGYTEIRAPVDGVIGNRSVRVGSYATIGAAMVSVVPSSGLWVDANFKENQLATMKAGQSVDIVADVLPDETFHGKLASLAPATGAQFSVLPAENATGNFTKIVQRVPVRVLLDGDGATLGKLRPGLSVTATVDTRTGADTRR